MVQRGQTFELTRRGAAGERLWAYRYRTGARGSKRVQRGGCCLRVDARDALERSLNGSAVSNAGASSGSSPGGRVGNDRPEPGQGPRRQRGTAAQGTASVRVMGGSTGGRSRDRTALRTNDPVRGRDRAAAGGMDRTREARGRSGRACRLRASLLHQARAQGPKTEESIRAVPLQARAPRRVDGIEDRNGSPLVFPGERGGYLDIHHFRPFQWRPAQEAVGISPLRRVYDLRHTFATFALRAGSSTFDLSRYMGASLTMIDRHYGHLARDGREHAIRLLDELSAEQRPTWTLVDARWTSNARVPASGGNTNGA